MLAFLYDYLRKCRWHENPAGSKLFAFSLDLGYHTGYAMEMLDNIYEAIT